MRLKISPVCEENSPVLQENVEDYEIIIVDDGSQDGTAELADRLAQEYPHVRAVHHEVNRGYGGAVKTGIQSCTKDWIFFTDGDAQFDVNEIAELLKYIDEYDAVVGYRMDRRDAAHRKLFAFCWGMLIRFLFGFGYKDLDCAFKLFRRKYFDGVDMKAEGAVISVELFDPQAERSQSETNRRPSLSPCRRSAIRWQSQSGIAGVQGTVSTLQMAEGVESVRNAVLTKMGGRQEFCCPSIPPVQRLYKK